MDKKILMHCYVTGKVQGVWFRAATKERADHLGITGWVCNLPDGRVEVIAAGDKNKIIELYNWLKKGPPLAQVTDLSYEELPWQAYSEFVVL